MKCRILFHLSLLGILGCEAPNIKIHPSSKTISLGSNLNLNVAATGTKPLTYQWQKNGKDLIDSNSNLLTLKNMNLADSGLYRVKVINSLGAIISEEAIVTIGTAPTFSAHPSNLFVDLEGSATFTAKAGGIGSIQYQWRKNGVDIPGANSPDYNITNVKNVNDNSYIVTATSPFGTTSSNAAKLIKPFLTADFSKIAALPDGWLVLNGEVAITNSALHLPAEPLEPHGIMFGPALPDNLRVAARFKGEAKGRQFPEFGLGLNGISGFRVMVSPGQKKLKLFRNDVLVHETDHTWVPGDWTHMTFQIQSLLGLKWRVMAKVWHNSELEPKEWQLFWTESVEPLTGRATVWGQPFSGTPIAVDDLRVWRVD